MAFTPFFEAIAAALLVLSLLRVSVVESAALYVSAGHEHTCAILHGSDVKCWGNGFAGRLGYENSFNRGDDGGEMGNKLPRVDLGSGRTAVQISTGAAHTCVILDNGRMKCWGEGDHGRLGYDKTRDRGDDEGEMGDSLAQVSLGNGRTVVQIDTGYAHTCAVLDNGELKCWGYGAAGQLGNGDTDDTLGYPEDNRGFLFPIDLGSGRTAVQVTAGDLHTCAVLDDFSVKCWGYGYPGRLGYGDTSSRGYKSGDMGDNLPTVDLGTGRTALHVAAGKSHTCVLLDDGTVKCWGYRSGYSYEDDLTRGDQPGEMGDDLPVVDLGTGRTAVQLSVGSDHSCAVLDDATLKCWGSNTGQLGYGHTQIIGDDPDEMGDNLQPVDVGAGRTVLQVSCSKSHTCARLDDQTVKCWGLGDLGRLGYGNDWDLGNSEGEMGDVLPSVNLGETISPTPLPTSFPTSSPSSSPTLSPTSSPTHSPTVTDADICGTIIPVQTTILERSSFGCDSLPTEIGLLVELTKIEVANSYLLGTIPSQLGNLRKLRELLLSGNDLAGEIPIELGRLTNLVEFHMFDNSLTGTMPSEIGLLSQLTALTLSDNLLVQELPSEFGELTNLEHLHVGQETPLALIPASIGRLSNLISLTLGEVCDCQLATILDGLTSLGAAERLVAATCNEQPSVSLSSDNAIPCSPVRVATVWNISEYAAEVSLTYSNRTEINKFASTFNVFMFAGRLFRTALDQFIQLNTSFVVPTVAKEIFSRCKAVFVSGLVDVQVWAFQFKLTNIITSEVTQTCVFAGSDGITRRAVGGLVDNFAYSLSIDPGEKYSLTVRPVVLTFESDKLVSYRYGPVSNSQRIVAADSIPDGPVRFLSVQTREDDRFSLQWTEPEKSNGRITRYTVIRDDGMSNVTLEFVILGESSQVSFTVPNLNSGSAYTVYVYPETTKGRGPPASIELETCPENMRTLKAGTSRCVAKRGFFLGKNGNAAIPCSLVDGRIDTTGCLEDDLNVRDLSIRRGFWRPSLDSFDIRRCPFGSRACTGGQNLSLCQPSYEGPMCAVCSNGFYLNGGNCDRCDELDWAALVALFAFLALFILIVVGVELYSIYMAKPNESAEKELFAELPHNTAEEKKTASSPSCKKMPVGDATLQLKVLVSTYQILGTFLWTLGTAFPRIFTDLLSILAIVSIEIVELVPGIQCLYDADFYAELLIVTVTPIVLLCLICVICLLVYGFKKVRDSKPALGIGVVMKHMIWWFVLVTFLVYAPAVSKIFRAFRPCDEFPDIGKAFMPEDYTIVCDSPEYWKVQNAAIVMCTIYVGIIPLCYAVLLCDKQDEIRRHYALMAEVASFSEKRKSDSKMRTPSENKLESLNEKLSYFSFLYKSYTYSWWELVEVVRKIVLAGAIAVIEPGSAEQSIILMLLALFSIALYDYFVPLGDNNALGVVSSYAIFFAAFASLLLKLRADFVDSSILDGFLIFAVLSPILVAVLYRRGLIQLIDKSCCPMEFEGWLDAAYKDLKKNFGRVTATPQPGQNVEHQSTGEEKQEDVRDDGKEDKKQNKKENEKENEKQNEKLQVLRRKERLPSL